MSRKFRKSPILASILTSEVVRVDDGEHMNDFALGGRIAEFIVNNNVTDRKDELIEEAARFYSESTVRKHSYERIVRIAKKKANERIEMLSEAEYNYSLNNEYSVYIFDPSTGEFETLLDTDDPYEAIKMWFEGNVGNRMCVAILAKDKESAKSLIKYASDNENVIIDLDDEYPSHYDIDFLLDAIQRYSKREPSGFYGNSPDQVYPFSLG